jgi:hypothetical protein
VPHAAATGHAITATIDGAIAAIRDRVVAPPAGMVAALGLPRVTTAHDAASRRLVRARSPDASSTQGAFP